MADFDYILPISTLYKGVKSDFEGFSNDIHVWFAQQIENAKKYGEVVYTFKTTKELKLINISSPLFYFDFIGKLNLLYRNNDGKDIRKCFALMPLGLPSLKEARRTLSSLNIDSYLNINEENEDVNNWASYFNSAYRFSFTLNNEKFDDNFVIALKSIYGSKYDGYIQPIPMPSILYGSGFSHEEICLFNTSNINQQKGGAKIKLKKKQKGGTKIIENPNLIVPHLEGINFDISKWNNEMNNYLLEKLSLNSKNTNIIKYAR